MDGVWHSSTLAQGAPGRNAQVPCHISVTFTCQNNSRLPLAPTSASSLCLSHALCVDSEGNLLKNITEHHRPESVHECVCWWRWWTWTVFPLFGWAVYLEMGRKTYCVSTGTLDLAQGVGTSTFIFCFFSETMKLIVLSEETCSLPKMFNPVHSLITIHGKNSLFHIFKISEKTKPAQNVTNKTSVPLKYKVCPSVSITCESQHILLTY